MTEPETIQLLVDMLDTGDPFVHVRFGDGDVFFATGTGPKITADGEEWSPELAYKLMRAWTQLAGYGDPLLLGDLETYDVSDGCEAEWRTLLSFLREKRSPDPAVCSKHATHMVHMEALRAARGHALPFYQAVASTERTKVFVGPERLAGAATMLGARHVPVPLGTAWAAVPELLRRVSWSDDIVLFAAGRGGKIMQGELCHRMPHLVQVDVGSGLDLMFDGVRRGTDAGITERNVEWLRHTYRDAGLVVNVQP